MLTTDHPNMTQKIQKVQTKTDIANGRGNFDEGYSSDYQQPFVQTTNNVTFPRSTSRDMRSRKPQRTLPDDTISSSSSTPTFSKQYQRGHKRFQRNGFYQQKDSRRFTFGGKEQPLTPSSTKPTQNQENLWKGPVIEDWKPEF